MGAALSKQLYSMENGHCGYRTFELADGSVATLERTASVSRARRIVGAGAVRESLRDVCTTDTRSGEDAGFVPAGDAPRVKQLRGLVPWGVRQ